MNTRGPLMLVCVHMGTLANSGIRMGPPLEIYVMTKICYLLIEVSSKYFVTCKITIAHE